jgi:hypothetical protein
MRIKGINFETWLKGHEQDHESRWCRELYPWSVFDALDYDRGHIGKDQIIDINDTRYVCRLLDVVLGKFDRPVYHIDLRTEPASDDARWKERQWAEEFWLVTTPDDHFITLFTKEEDPSKLLLKAFLNGNFKATEATRSLPVADMLFRSIVSYQIKDTYPDVEHARVFPWMEPWQRDLPIHTDLPIRRVPHAPLASRERDLWIHAVTTEEKAHRFAFNAARQCKELKIIYLTPTLTRHHRCDLPDVQIVSLSNFIGRTVTKKGSRFVEQVRHLLDDLRTRDLVPTAKRATTLLKEALAAEGCEPSAADLGEAKAALEWDVYNAHDAAYFFASANLINAVLSNDHLRRKFRLGKDVYSFKARVGDVIESLIEAPVKDVLIDLHDDGLAMATIQGVQFTYHAIPRSQRMKDYADANKEVVRSWLGKRLQPIAPLLLKWARAQLMEQRVTR